MTPTEIAGRAAEAVMRTIEDTKRINKREITEAIEGVLLVSQQHSYDMALAAPRQPDERDAVEAFRLVQRMLCGND